MNIKDVRAAIRSFEGKDIASEFARREALAREAFNEQLAESRAKKTNSAAGLALNSLGLQGQSGSTITGEPSAADGFEQGKMLMDLMRERGIKHFEALDKDIRQNSETWLKQMAEEEKKLQDEQVKSFRGMIGESWRAIWGGSKKE